MILGISFEDAAAAIQGISFEDAAAGVARVDQLLSHRKQLRRLSSWRSRMPNPGRILET